MTGNSENREGNERASQPMESAFGWNLSRRSLLGAGALLGFAALTQPTDRAFAWSSWTNATSGILKKIGMGDCVHEDLVQIAYARVVRRYRDDGTKNPTLLNPWAGKLSDDNKTATIAGDTVERGRGKTFEDADDLAKRLFRENLAYLRIGSFWNDAAANMLADFALSCYAANSIPKFSGENYYQGAWDVGQHIHETDKANGLSYDALVQFTMNDRNNFIHGMLSSTADHSAHLRQSEVKEFALQWLGVAYEYARTGEVRTTKQVTVQDQAQKIFKGFIDTYDQLSNDAHDMCVTLKVSSTEASKDLPHRRLRLRALGMMCHTMEDFWCPAHTCRTYSGKGIQENAILAFSNYKLQNGDKMPMFGYHIPFDRYATSDSNNETDWREALTRGDGSHAGTETLEKVLNDNMADLDTANPFDKFNTLGMNESIDCITKLLDFLYQDVAWDDEVYNWVNETVMPTYFTSSGQSYVCDAGRRGLHSPTYVIAPIKAMKRAYRKAGLSDNYEAVLAAAKGYNSWQQGAHLFFSGQYNTNKKKTIDSDIAGTIIRSDSAGEKQLEELVSKLHEGYSGLSPEKQSDLLARIGCNGCHDMVGVIDRVRGMLQEFNIELRGSLRTDDAVMKNLEETRAFFYSGVKGNGKKLDTQSSRGLLAAGVAFANEGDDGFITSSMALEDIVSCEDGSYLIGVRDMDSLDTSVMTVPKDTPGKDKLEEGVANLTIKYTLDTEFEDDPDYCYVVSEIDYTDMEEDEYLITGTVKSVSEDKKSLVLDSNGLSEHDMTIRDGVTDIPEAGMYICARYAIRDSKMEFYDYDELDNPGELIKVTYPVAMVAGSSVWLCTNEGKAEDGYRDYLQIDYGSADIDQVPEEGKYATVYYHDEAYGDTTDVDERGLAIAAYGVNSADMSTQAEADDDDVDGTVDEPGYKALGEDYSKLEYGNEVFHIANVIVGSDDEAEDTPQGGGDSPSESTSSSSSSSSSAASKGSQSATPKTSASKASATPKTADPLVGFGGLLSVAAVAGTAMAAYSARRVANERRKSEED